MSSTNMTVNSTINDVINSATGVNEFVVKFANVNGTGSASANQLFAKAIFRMGIPISPKNIFPSNIQGLPTWYEVRISEKGYVAARDGIDVMVSVNPQSMANDVKEVVPNGYFVYDSSKPIDLRLIRDDINYIGIPFTKICNAEYTNPRQRQLFKNIIYVGSLAALLNMDFSVLTDMIGEQFKGKEKLIAPNIHALELGYQYASHHFECPLPVHVEKRDCVGDKILVNGNTAAGLGAVYAGATVAAWYPITPSTSVVEAFDKYANRLRIDPGTGEKNFAVVQAEDELSAIGMAIGACWNGARAFTATSGPGISLMSEFLGLAYFAELPVVLVDVQRSGPSTGMPTRTQQSDVLACAYASHGDTKQVLLFPSDPKDCFDMAVQAFDVAERVQTPVILLSDLDIGMNDVMCEPLVWDDQRIYDRGKVMTTEDLENATEKFGRYLDVDGDGICYRTYPGTHPTKGSFFTRGTSRDPYAIYTESGEEYQKNMERLLRKWQTTVQYLPKPEFFPSQNTLPGKQSSMSDGLICYGSSRAAMTEAMDNFSSHGVFMDGLCIKAFPFAEEIRQFIDKHDRLFVIEQNRDAQIRSLLINEFDIDPAKLVSVLHYHGSPITAASIAEKVQKYVGPTDQQAKEA
ncbi:MAG: 2-oxoacid:acceptor oxidoreductase subunit alpha [Cellvibrionaceae bacterium]